MNTIFQRSRAIIQMVIPASQRVWLKSTRILQEQFNKNIYTRILFTNVTGFVVALIALAMLSSFVVKQTTYDHVQQELLRKAKRVNFALLQQKDLAKGTPILGQTSDPNQARQNLLKFLADSFDARITVFDKEGNIIITSADQEVVPGSKVKSEVLETITTGETAASRILDRETGQSSFIAVVPMGNNKDAVENGILLETDPSKLDIAINKIHFYLVLGGMVMLIIIIIVSVYLAMYISRPISRLATAVGEISMGSEVLEIEDHTLDEINVLARELKKLNARLQMIQAETRMMEEERARLFAEISHELRTPLTAVQGFVEAIRDGMVQDETLLDRYLNTIYTQTVHITRLVDDILALSRIESGNIVVEKQPVDLNALAHGVTVSMEAMAKSRNTVIVLDKNIENAVVLGDVDRLEQIIRNLLKNAIMATENGTIRVGVDSRQNETVLTIEDDGIGISPEDLPHIWDRFFQVKNQRGSYLQEKGSGLGMVIVKKLVQLQNGKISVVSQLGKGTTFTIAFPSLDAE